MDNNYGVLHEIGDYSAFKPLSDKDNKAFNEQVNSQQQNKDKKEKDNK